MSEFQFELRDRRCATRFRAWIAVIFAAEAYSSPNGRPLCTVPAFERRIDQTIGVGLLLGAPPNVEGYFSYKK
jgi:hypothetical protein